MVAGRGTPQASPGQRPTELEKRRGGRRWREKLPWERHVYSLTRCTGRKAPEEAHVIVVRPTARGPGAKSLIHAAPLELTSLSGGRY